MRGNTWVMLGGHGDCYWNLSKITICCKANLSFSLVFLIWGKIISCCNSTTLTLPFQWFSVWVILKSMGNSVWGASICLSFRGVARTRNHLTLKLQKLQVFVTCHLCLQQESFLLQIFWVLVCLSTEILNSGVWLNSGSTHQEHHGWCKQFSFGAENVTLLPKSCDIRVFKIKLIFSNNCWVF